MATGKDITSRRFGRLTALSYNKTRRDWLCECDCGEKRYVRITALVRGRTVSCGCYRRGRASPSTTHGRTETPEYRSWRAMKRRCLNPRASQYSYYGGRGVTVCERWLTFANFFADMGDKPSPEHSLERLNNDGPYTPDNCIWATRSQQVTNRRPSAPRERTCVVCCRAFVTRSSRAKFCSVAHSSEFHRQLRKNRISSA